MVEPLLVIGIGNPYRGDDAAGILVARELQSVAPRGMTVTENHGDVPSLIEAWHSFPTVILVDAVRGPHAAGTVIRHEVGNGPLPETFTHTSTHGLGIPEAVALSRALGQFPLSLILIGIVGEQFAAGAPVTPAVLEAVNDVVITILDTTSIGSGGELL